MSDPTKAVATVAPAPAGDGLDYARHTSVLWTGAGDRALSKDQARALAYVGRRLNLHPALGEVMLVESRVYITLAGYQAIAQRYRTFAGMQLRPLTPDERKTAMIAADEHAWTCEIHRSDWKVPYLSLGRASERQVRSDKLKPHVIEIAQARAVRRGLKAVFSYDVPPELRADEEDAIDLGAVELVDAETGELETATAPRLREARTAAEPTAPTIAPDWAGFWAKAHRWGATDADVHAALRIESVKDWPHSLAEALDVIFAYLEQKPKNGGQVAPPPASDRLALLARCRQLKDNADALGVQAREVSDRWDLTTLQRWFDEVSPKVKAAEEREAKKATSQSGLDLDAHDSI